MLLDIGEIVDNVDDDINKHDENNSTEGPVILREGVHAIGFK